MSTKNSNRFTPVVIAVSIVLGILIGTFYAKHFAGNRLGIINGSSNKLNALLRIVSDQYVDTVNMADLVEEAMPQILAELDPHSTYIPAQKLEEVNAELEGSFSGIGIQFTIQNDTIHVNAVIQGGPSEKVGLMAGDRIVTVDDSLFVGKKLTNERAMRSLKGTGEKDLLSFNITRGDIPQNTVDAAYMLNDRIGYIKVSKFGRTSHVELLNALAQLNHKQCKGLIVDLRGNTGGYMEAAIRMVNEFLPEGKLIVYTQGRKYPEPSKTTTAVPSSVAAPLERDWCSSLLTSATDRPSGSPLHATTRRRDAAYSAPMKTGKTATTSWISTTATSTVSSSRATVSSRMKKNASAPAWDVPSMAAVESCPTSLCLKIPLA